MAKFFKRIGTKRYKFEFEADIEKVQIAVGFDCEVSVLLKRGDHKAQTTRQEMDVAKGNALFMEPLSVPVTLFYDSKHKKYLEKKCTFTVILHTERGSKIAGTTEFDLASFPNNNKTNAGEVLKLKGIDPNAKLMVKIKLHIVGEVANNESMITEEKSARAGDNDSEEEEASRKKATTTTTTTQQPRKSFAQSIAANQDEDDEDLEDKFFRKNEQEDTSKSKNLSQAEIASVSSKNDEEVKHESFSHDEDDHKIDSPPKFDSIATTESMYSKKSPIISASESQSTETSMQRQKQQQQTSSSRDQTPPSSDKKPLTSNTTLTQKAQPVLNTAGGAKPKTPIVINTQEIEKNLKSVNVFKKGAADSDKKPGFSESHQATKPSEQPRGNFASGMNLNPTKQGSNDPRDTTQTMQNSSRSLKPEPSMSIASQGSDKYLPQERTKSNEVNVVPERESMRTGKNFELEKKVLLNKLESAELQLKQVKQENEGLREEVQSKDDEITRFKGLLETAKKKISDLSYSKNQTDISNSGSDRLRELLESQSADNSRLIQENSELNEKIDELKKLMYNNNKENAKKLKDMQLELDKYRGSSGETERELATLKEQKNILADKNAKLEQDLRNLRADYQTLSHENASNLEMYNALKDENSEVESSQKTTDIELRKYKEKSQNLEKEVERLKGEIKLGQQQLESLRSRGNELAKKASEMQTRLTTEKQELEQKLKTTNDAYKEYMKNSERQTADLKKQVKDAEARREEALSKQTELSIQMQTLKINNDRLQTELETKKGSFQDTNKDLEETLNEIKKENTQLRARWNALDAKFKESEERHYTNEENLRKELLLINDKCQQLEAQNEKLRGTTKNKEHESSLEATQLKDQILNLKKENEKQHVLWQQTISQRDSQLKLLESENQVLEQRIAQLEKEAAVGSKNKGDKEGPELASKLSGMQQLLRTSQTNHSSEVESLQREIRRLKAELEVAKEQGTRENENELASLEVENEKLKKQLKELSNKAANDKASLESQAIKENQVLKGKLTAIQKTNQQYEEEIQQLNITVQKLQSDQKAARAKEMAETMKDIQNDVVRSKQKLGDIMNCVLELGSDDLQEKVFAIVNAL